LTLPLQTEFYFLGNLSPDVLLDRCFNFMIP